MTEEGKKKFRRRKWKIIIFIIAGILSIVAIAPLFINQIIEHNIKQKLEQLAPFVTVRFSSVHADLLNSSIAINDLSVKFQPDLSDSSHYHLINYSKVAFTGVNFIAVVRRNELAINKTILSNGEITLDPFLLSKKDSLPPDLLTRVSFKNVSMNHLETRETNVRMHLKKNNQCKISKMEIAGLNKSVDSGVHFTSFAISISNIDYSIPHAYRTLHIDSLEANSKEKSVKIAGDGRTFISLKGR